MADERVITASDGSMWMASWEPAGTPSPTVQPPIEVAPACVLFQRVGHPSNLLILEDPGEKYGPLDGVSDEQLTEWLNTFLDREQGERGG